MSANLKQYAKDLTTLALKYYPVTTESVLETKASQRTFEEPQLLLRMHFEEEANETQNEGYVLIHDTIKHNQEKLLKPIYEFLEDQHITGLSRYEAGHLSQTFVARGASDKVFLFRIGQEDNLPARRVISAPSTFTMHNRIWSPLNIQALAKNTLVVSDKACEEVDPEDEPSSMRVALEILPLLPVHTVRQTSEVTRAFNRIVLADTPYHVEENADIAILPGGSMLFVHPSSLNFRTDSLAREHSPNQFGVRWQQSIMSVIKSNCEKAGMPDNLRWVFQRSINQLVSLPQVLGERIGAEFSPQRSALQDERTIYCGKQSLTLVA